MISDSETDSDSAGLQIYKGTMKHKCVLDPRHAVWEPADENTTSANNVWEKWNKSEWAAWNNDVSHWYPPDPYNFLMCGKDAGECPPEYNCTESIGPNPNFGYTNFGMCF